MSDREPSIYEFAGGRQAWLRLADEQYHRCLRDPVLAEQFTTEHEGHVEHLAAWLVEVFGGPDDYTQRFGGFTAMLDHHVDLDITEEQRARFVEVTMEAADAAGLPDDPRFRERLRGYVEWGTHVAVRNSEPGHEADRTATVPTWGWGAEGPPRRSDLPTADAAPPTDEWEIGRLDLDAYLLRIAYDGPLAPDAATLQALHRAHAARIPFENLDILLGRGIALDLDSVQDKLVRRLRGGYCFEHNLLLGAVLERLGYQVSRLAARVVPGGGLRTHMLLRVVVDGREWLADVGFGASLLEPLAFDAGVAVRQGGWRYHLDHDESRGAWLLRSEEVDRWVDLYEFTLEPQRPGDYLVYNHFTSTHPRSPFVGQVVALRVEPDVQHALRSHQLTTKRPDGATTARDVALDELAGVLAETFGIHLDAEEEAELRRRAADGLGE